MSRLSAILGPGHALVDPMGGPGDGHFLSQVNRWWKIIEIIDIECVLLSFFSENFVSTKWRIYKGIFGSSRLLRKGISRGREECDYFFLSNKVYKKI